MNLYSIKTIKELLRTYNTAAKDHLGQNFLLEKRVAVKMLLAAELSIKDTVLEIGPGIGTLTKELAKKAKQVISIEKDSFMIEILKETLYDFNNVKIIQGDALKLSYPQLNKTKFKVIANLPYSIASPLIRMFLEAKNKPDLMVCMVQKEVAQRMCAKQKDMNLLAVSIQFYAEPKIVSFVKKSAFWPMPKVDSAILKIVPKKELPPLPPELFFRIVKAGFSQPRKQLINNLSNQLKLSRQEITTWLKKEDIHPTKRAATLSLKDWIGLVKSFPKI